MCLLPFLTAAGVVDAGTAPVQTPRAGLWSTGPHLITGRERHTATLLRDGRVLVTGGSDGRNTALATAEIYNPKTHRWTAAGRMSTPRLAHAATLLASGKVLVVGGIAVPMPSSTLASAEVYDPATNGWSAVAPMSGGRARPTATRLRDGRVLVVGGISLVQRGNEFFEGGASDAEIYDPVANRWSGTAPMALYRHDHTATMLADGRVLVAGGDASDQPGPLETAEVYDPGQDRWLPVPSMGTGRLGHAATLLANGTVAVTGGIGAGITPFRAVEIYDPRLNSWSPRAPLADAHVGETAISLGTGAVLVVGTTDRSQPELYDPGHNRWLYTGPTMLRYNQTATRLGDGRVLIAGGYGLESLASSLIFDPNGVAPVPLKPLDPRMLAALLFAGLLLGSGIAWSIPGVRQRVKRLRPAGDEWVEM